MNYTVLDIETSSDQPWVTDENPHGGKLVAVGLGQRVYNAEDGRDALARFFEAPGLVVCHTNFDLRWMTLAGVRLGRDTQYHDTKVMAWMLDQNQTLTLDDLAERYLGERPPKPIKKIQGRIMFDRDVLDEAIGLGVGGLGIVPIEDVPWDEMHAYNLSDITVTARLYEYLRAELQRRDLWQHFVAEEAPFSRLLVEIETAGIPFDRDNCLTFGDDLRAQADEIRAGLVEDVGWPGFNPGSWQQISDYLYGEQFTLKGRFAIPRMNGIPKDEKLERARALAPRGFIIEKVGRDYATGTFCCDGLALRPPKRQKWDKPDKRPSTNAKTLTVLHGTHPWVSRYLEFKRVDRLAGFCTQWAVRTRLGRLHGRFDQSGTVTGRLAAKQPNLQQVPNDANPDLRTLFCGDLVIGDYSGLEVRLSAHFSGDRVMLDIFNQGHDLYGTLAAHAWGGDATKANPARGLMKVIMLGSQYGAQGEKLGDLLAIAGMKYNAAEADELLAELKRTLPRLFEWRDEVIEDAKRRGYVETLAGRRRYLPDLEAAAWHVAAKAERQAVNTVVQGSAADVVRRAMLAARRVVHPAEAFQVLQVHDEIIWQRADMYDADVFARIMWACEQGHGFTLDCPLKFDCKEAQSWSEKGGSAGQIKSGAYADLEDALDAELMNSAA